MSLHVLQDSVLLTTWHTWSIWNKLHLLILLLSIRKESYVKNRLLIDPTRMCDSLDIFILGCRHVVIENEISWVTVCLTSILITCNWFTVYIMNVIPKTLRWTFSLKILLRGTSTLSKNGTKCLIRKDNGTVLN